MSQAKNNIIKHAQLNWSDQSEPYSTMFDDIYFNNNQGHYESQYVFFEGNHLAHRWVNFKQKQFCIVETGFGSGLNFLNSAQQFIYFKKNNIGKPLQRLHFISFEKYPLTSNDIQLSLKKLLQFSNLLESLVVQYPMPLLGCHRLFFDGGNIILDLWFGDINEQIDNLSNVHNGIADAWYLDGFNPSTNPDMWHLALFKKMVALSNPQATLATFTAAGFVRRALNEAGFIMQKRKGYGKKREMLVGYIPEANPINNHVAMIKKATKAIPNQADDIAIIGGGIAGLCSALALAKRDHKVTVYCAESTLGTGASGNLQGALYPLLNGQHDALGQLFSNAYQFALNFYHEVNQHHPFSHQFNGLIQLAYDSSSTKKLQKIKEAGLPEQLVHWIDTNSTNQLAGLEIDHPALYYPRAGWLSPRQLINSLAQLLAEYDNVTIHCNYHIEQISYNQHAIDNEQWILKRKRTSISKNALPENTLDISLQTTPEQSQTENVTENTDTFKHQTLVIAAGFDSLNFQHCRAVPLSAARGQVSHIDSTPELTALKRTLCHEGYLTPAIAAQHCMGATFKRHDSDTTYRETEQKDNHQKLKKCITDKAWVDNIVLNNQAHTAIRCTTRDHFPYVGELTDYDSLKKSYEMDESATYPIASLPNAYLLTGLGSRGLCSAPLLAEILASKINKESLPVANYIDEKMKIPRQWLSYISKNKPLKA
ncbi:FAD-dependent 5-carboxymethylaminomethyl-2-thiouridine(34) oxidoreductase MnmC [uncultured Psychromonas sp.]|uniref:FAD-dependent 5-carboxymethylaminomethyl-2-thiouridine(34) oxidoreductase MnmC n=1 Tax=uncultured Psychromonas sp. TaxID=173974 RepID=UPI00262F30F2|nr:FAD-dependent 5-carboxymethylaminomethyl-2-thiouridine(34) oxidoreductase MnmC [uncultured Psychromonas sp.]